MKLTCKEAVGTRFHVFSTLVGGILSGLTSIFNLYLGLYVSDLSTLVEV